jgi:hypothetical protein
MIGWCGLVGGTTAAALVAAALLGIVLAEEDAAQRQARYRRFRARLRAALKELLNEEGAPAGTSEEGAASEA